MKRAQLNFVIDAAAFAAFLFLLSTGLLLRYQLPPGSGGLHAAGSGRGASERLVTLLWGWTRHEWGQIHYWIAGVLIAILAFHLLLHWKWIVCVVRGAHSDASGLRFGLGVASLIALVLLSAAPLLAPTQSVTRGNLQQQQSELGPTDDIDSAQDIRGSMTVLEVAEAAGIPVAELLGRLNLSAEASPNERIGRLLRQHGLQMSDLRRVLASDKFVATKETEQ